MITPILLCGGSGTRLWPLSRKSFPKQFVDLLGDESLFQASARRFVGPEFYDPLVVTGDDFRFVVSEQLAEIDIKPSDILIEPEGRNTAPAAIAAALYVAQQSSDAYVLLVPSDHAVANPEAFRASALLGLKAAEAGQIVTFGIAPQHAETGYGWLEAGDEIEPGLSDLVRFIEKPNALQAKELFENDQFLWNSGVFLAKASVLIEAFQTYAPAIYKTVLAAMNAAKKDLEFTRIDPDLWAKVPEDSIDYAVMEKAQNISVVHFNGDWSDLGSWEAVWRESETDTVGNSVSNNSTAYNCENVLLRSETPDVELVGIGLQNIVAVATRDAVMVADISKTQNVKEVVSELKARGTKQATTFPIDRRPWGWFESLVIGERFQVKRIYVHPGAALSLQSHHHRSEHWIVVQGTALVTIDDDVKLVTENQSVYIPLGAVHRMENPGKVPMILIEVQTGSYLGEDDIIRYEDIYARS